ncbi:MAG: glycine cleavage system aminomethyltransferase GcvT [Nitrososphaerales archaeon]
MQSIKMSPSGVSLKRTHLNDFHTLHGTMGEFGGFSLPIFYSGISGEHMAVREGAGLFDISHMGRLRLKGDDSTSLLNSILPSEVGSYKIGKAFYSFLLNDEGGIIDDIVVMKISENDYLLIVNAANIEKDTLWITNHSKNLRINLEDVSPLHAMFALQGPKARLILERISSTNIAELKRFEFIETEFMGNSAFLSRTGYTGEDGFEMILESPIQNPKAAVEFWRKIIDSGSPDGLIPCGLGARDTLRLEAGLCLHGLDIDESVTPLEADLSRFVHLEKEFVGRKALLQQGERGLGKVRKGILMLSMGIPRHGHEIFINNASVGRVTSGTYSPLLRKGIAMGYIGKTVTGSEEVEILIRGTKKDARIVEFPFYDPKKYGVRRAS